MYRVSCILVILSATLVVANGAAVQEKRGLQAMRRLQEKPHHEPQVHNTIQLPVSAHRTGEAAGFFVDPLTGNRVYRLSDATMCPAGATHFYSYTLQFSPQGRIVFDCRWGRNHWPLHPVYGANFELLFEDAVQAAHAPGAGDHYASIQWSEEREVLFATVDGSVVELDPFKGKTRTVVNFVDRIQELDGPEGRKIRFSIAKELSVGPSDRLMVHLQCRRSDRGCPEDWKIVGVGVYDPATDKAQAIYVPVPGDRAPNGFDEAQWSENPKGRITVVYGNARNFSYSANLSSRAQYDDYHGHRGYFCGSNGRCYLVKVKTDDLPNGGAGQVGCRRPDGSVAVPWRPEYGLYDDETGKRVLIIGCDIPGQNPWQHIARSPGAKDVFGISTERFTFDPSLKEFFPDDEAIVRAVVRYSGDQPSHVDFETVAYHRSATGPRGKWLGRACDYWASPRAVLDHTGTRFLFESTMSHPEWPSIDRGSVKTDCRTDVYVAVDSQKK